MLRLFSHRSSHLLFASTSSIRATMSTAKRKATTSNVDNSPPTKRPKIPPEYHESPMMKESDGSFRWPAPLAQIQKARELIQESARSTGNILIVPDKDSDGLSSGAILRHTLRLLGASLDRIFVHLPAKGDTVHSASGRQQMAAFDPSYIFVLDQGSRNSPPLVDNPDTKGLVIDHHYATENDFPEGCDYVTACESPPVATTSLLTYHICKPLHPDAASLTDWLCVVGTHGDLGNSLKWESPFPDMKPTFKKYTKKVLHTVVSLVNAPRRTATYDVRSAWDALCDITDPALILKNERLLHARAEVNSEVERCTHAAPVFSADGKVAVFRIRSEAQVHPVIATRWAGHLKSPLLEMVMVANEGYLPDKVNFSCRVARCAKGRDTPVDIIQNLKAYASLPEIQDPEHETAASDADDTIPLLARLGDNFARGHVQASGGIVDKKDFEELMRRMEVGKKTAKASPAKPKKMVIDSGQKNSLLTYFKKS